MWSYLAGLFDGDGSVHIGRSVKKGRGSIYFNVRITTCHLEASTPIIGFLISEGVLNPKNKNIYAANRTHKRQIYRITICSTPKVEQFIRGIYPHLIYKRKQCDVLLQAIKEKNRIKLTPNMNIADNVPIFDVFRHELHKLSTKGPRTLKSWQ